MKYDFDDLYEGPRFQNRARKRKIKLIISSIGVIIGIVLVIGVITIFSGGKEEAKGKVEDTTREKQSMDSGKDIEKGTEANTDSSTDLNSDTNDEKNGESVDDDSEGTEEDFTISKKNRSVSNEKMDSNSTNNQDKKLVMGTEEEDLESVGTEQGDMEPAGTEQEGDHVTNFTKDSQDWKEMTEAVSGATGLSSDNMIVWWMGNGGGTNKAISKVSTKDKQTYYQVQLEWVDNKGWKPVSVEEMNGNDSNQGTGSTTEETSETN